jgi:glycosyltransferase involved in cell wall biosynthesis
MEVTIVDSDLPYPPTSGKRLRTLNLMLPLARRHRITYICRGDAAGPETRPALEFLRDHGVAPLLVDHPPPRKRGAGFFWRLAANLASRLPYSVAAHLSRPLADALRRHAATARVDLWQVEWAGPFPLLPHARGLRTVINSPNVDTLIWQRSHEAERRPLRRWYIRRQWRKFERFERRVFAAATRVVVVSDDDAALVRGRFGVATVDVVENGMDRLYFEGVTGRREAGRILFLGSLDWRPNQDGVRLLLDDILPAVRRAEPAARLVIVGRQAPAWLAERVRHTEGVELHADVPDVRPFLGACGVLAVPLRIGGGSRLKILEALATGLPVVSTKIGAEGLCLRPGEEFVQAEPAEMAAALVEAIRFPGRIRALAERGRRLVLEHYDWEGLADRLERVWETCVAGQETS